MRFVAEGGELITDPLTMGMFNSDKLADGLKNAFKEVRGMLKDREEIVDKGEKMREKKLADLREAAGLAERLKNARVAVAQPPVRPPPPQQPVAQPQPQQVVAVPFPQPIPAAPPPAPPPVQAAPPPVQTPPAPEPPKPAEEPEAPKEEPQEEPPKEPEPLPQPQA